MYVSLPSMLLATDQFPKYMKTLHVEHVNNEVEVFVENRYEVL